jgi:hypothetical protein
VNDPLPSHPDAARSRLRTLIAAIEQEFGGRDRPARWSELVEALALGPEPEVRRCTHCSRLTMRAATRCGYCWAVLTPA